MKTENVLEDRWKELIGQLAIQFGKEPDLNGVLLLIGIRELGQVKKRWSKEDKVNLMHIAVCKLLSQEGHYQLEGHDKDGWPHWKLNGKLPYINVVEQEIYLKEQVLVYFNTL